MNKKELLTKQTISILLPDIRSAYNVGSIFRTADAAGIDRVYISGISPRPIDRFNRPQKEIAKTALGAEQTIPWEYSKNTNLLLKKLKKNGAYIIAIELSKNSVDYKKIKLSSIKHKEIVFVVGNEVEGLSKPILEKADVIAEIPMKGKKESLNVGVSVGIVLFRVLNV